MKQLKHTLTLLLFAGSTFLPAQQQFERSWPKPIIYKCWIYTIYDMPAEEGFLYQLEDSSIITTSDFFPYEDRTFDELEIRNIEKIKIRRQGNVGRGVLYGLLAGFAYGAVKGLISGDSSFDRMCNRWCHTAPMKAVIFGFGNGLLGITAGYIIGNFKLNIPIDSKQIRYLQKQEKLKGYVIQY